MERKEEKRRKTKEIEGDEAKVKRRSRERYIDKR